MATGRAESVRYRILTTSDELDVEGDSLLESDSIANLLTIAEGFQYYAKCIDTFEMVLLTCWQSFRLLGDITIEFAPALIVIHTKHAPDSPNQVNIVILTSGVVAAGYRIAGDQVAQGMNSDQDWDAFLGGIADMRTNVARRLRIE